MRNFDPRSLRYPALVGMALVVTLTGCGGGGGGGGGGGSLPGFLALSSSPIFGSRIAGVDTQQIFASQPTTGIPIPSVGGSATVPPANFVAGAPDGQDFIQLSFNVPVLASSIFGTGPGTAGIVIEDAFGNPQPFALDQNGVIDPSNAFPGDGTAPATLRLYYDPDPGGNLLSPNFMPPGQYVLRILSTNLKAFGGGPFCTGAGSANCQNTLDPAISFSIGGDNTNPAVAQVTPSVPTQFDVNVSIAQEITLNFSEAIDFPSLVGAGNISSLDPFISVPFPMPYAAQICDPTAAPPVTVVAPIAVPGGNLYMNYTPYTDPLTQALEQIPAGCAFIVYMPSPVLAPGTVRIRPVDGTNLIGANGGGAFQNYASNPSRFPIASTDPAQNGAILQLPPVLPFAGSRDPDPVNDPVGGDVHLGTLDVVVMSAGFVPFGPPAGVTRNIFVPGSEMCYTPSGNGLTDRSGNGIQSDFWVRVSFANGPTLARNPGVPHATFIGIQGPASAGISVLNTDAITTDIIPTIPGTGGPLWAGTNLTGTLKVQPNRLDNSAIVGLPVDLEVGGFIDTSGGNNTANPPLGGAGSPGVPDTQNGTTPCGLLQVVLCGTCQTPPPPGCPAAPPQPLGSYLYVADGANEVVRVLNTYDFSLITTLVGIPFPNGLGILPNLQELYVSNREQASVTIVNTNPASPFFHQVITAVTVGNGPRAISAHPGGEDVFVLNFSENTYSIVDAQLQQERVRFNSGLGPTDVFITNRMIGCGLTNAYTAFITNFFSGDVSIYESDSPSVPSNGPDGNAVALFGGFSGPSRGCWNWQSYVTFVQELGCYVSNSLGRSVDELSMFNFTLGPPPGFPGPAGRRDFHVRKSYSSFASQQVGDTAPSDVSIDGNSGLYNFNQIGVTNNKSVVDPAIGGGVPSVVLVSFPGAGRVVAYNYNSTALVGIVEAPGCDFLQSYYDQ